MLEKFVEINNLKMFYRIFHKHVEIEQLDHSQLIMVVLHGALGLIDHQIELEAFMSFSEKVQLVFIDQRGCGRTTGGTVDELNFKQCGDDLYNFCIALQIKNPILTGISMGGFVIMSCIEDHPSLPRAIIFCNTEAKKLPNERRNMFLKLGGSIAERAVVDFDNHPDDVDKTKIFFETCIPYFSKKPFSLTPPYKTDFNIWSKASKEWSTNMDYRETLKKSVRCPALILAGEDDPNHPLASAKQLVDSIPKQFCYFKPIPGAGAPVYQDQPESFKAAINEFLINISAAVM